MGCTGRPGRSPRRAQAALVAENRRLRRQIAALEGRLRPGADEDEQLEALLRQNEQLAASARLAALVAHELNTPLQAVENYLFLAADDVEYEAALLPIRQEIGRIGAIVERLRDFQPADGAAPAPIEVNDLVERVLLLMGSQLRRQRVSVTRDLAAGLPALHGSDSQLTLVLLNLVFRAAARMPHGGTLDIATRASAQGGPFHGARQREQRLTIELTDTGDAGEAAAVEYGPFYSTDAAGPEMRLDICRRLLAGHGGTLMLWDEIGGGHKAVVALPLAAALP